MDSKNELYRWLVLELAEAPAELQRLLAVLRAEHGLRISHLVTPGTAFADLAVDASEVMKRRGITIADASRALHQVVRADRLVDPPSAAAFLYRPRVDSVEGLLARATEFRHVHHAAHVAFYAEHKDLYRRSVRELWSMGDIERLAKLSSVLTHFTFVLEDNDFHRELLSYLANLAQDDGRIARHPGIVLAVAEHLPAIRRRGMAGGETLRLERIRELTRFVELQAQRGGDDSRNWQIAKADLLQLSADAHVNDWERRAEFVLGALDQAELASNESIMGSIVARFLTQVSDECVARPTAAMQSLQSSWEGHAHRMLRLYSRSRNPRREAQLWGALSRSASSQGEIPRSLTYATRAVELWESAQHWVPVETGMAGYQWSYYRSAWQRVADLETQI